MDYWDWILDLIKEGLVSKVGYMVSEEIACLQNIRYNEGPGCATIQ